MAIRQRPPGSTGRRSRKTVPLPKFLQSKLPWEKESAKVPARPSKDGSRAKPNDRAAATPLGREDLCVVHKPLGRGGFEVTSKPSKSVLIVLGLTPSASAMRCIVHCRSPISGNAPAPLVPQIISHKPRPATLEVWKHARFRGKSWV